MSKTPQPKPPAKALNGSHKINTDAKTHRAETFATNAITTLTHQNAAGFTLGSFQYLFSCWRTLDQVRIQKVFPRDRVPGFSNTVDLPEMGVQLYCNDTTCSIFPTEGQPIAPGQTYHHFLLKHGDKEMMASVALEIRSVTKPTAAKFTRDVQARAAFDAYRAKCASAQDDLIEELARIMEVHTDRLYAELTPPNKPRSTGRVVARKSKAA